MDQNFILRFFSDPNTRYNKKGGGSTLLWFGQVGGTWWPQAIPKNRNIERAIGDKVVKITSCIAYDGDMLTNGC